MWVLRMEMASIQHSGAQNFQAANRLKKIVTITIIIHIIIIIIIITREQAITHKGFTVDSTERHSEECVRKVKNRTSQRCVSF